MRRLGLPALPDHRRSPQRDRALALVAERVLRPASKLASVDADSPYEAMDWLAERQWRIKRRLAKRHLAEGSRALRRQQQLLIG